MTVSGVLIHVRPADAARVGASLAALPGVEVHTPGDDGRMVVTIEGDNDRDVSDMFVRLHDIQGVVAVTLAWHHSERSEEPDEAHAT
ncbi:MAG: periplasmic nitrate reductase NapD [Gammaproteobacteria bacterium]|nr:MAG: periplasmic nitrate reductase NapD [Gammaproteobacteria bacterium]